MRHFTFSHEIDRILDLNSPVLLSTMESVEAPI